MPKRGRILIVDDDRGLLRTNQVLLEDEGGYETVTASSGADALEALETHERIRLVLSDLSMPGMDGIELLQAIRERRPAIPVVLMTAYGSVASAVQAMKLGAAQYLSKPVDPDELLLQVERTLRQAAMEGEHRRLKARAGDPEHFDVLVGESPSIVDLRESISRLAEVDSTVLIRGETGTGKELVARLIHRASLRSGLPFVAVNCTSIPGELLESELFGHEKGSFTGATESRIGRIEEAEGGTLFLDEIGDMSSTLQPKILRFLQELTIRRIGGKRERKVDLRILAATHRNLETAMAEGEFRQDLFYRLSAIPLELPPLRDRSGDLPLLCEHLLAKLARRLARSEASISPEALASLASYGFPGNVRELENLLERAIVLGSLARKTGRIEAEDLPRQLASRRPGSLSGIPLEGGISALEAAHKDAERELLERALRAWPGLSNMDIAEKLGTNRRVLELRLKAFGLSKRSTKPESS